jgi:uncharacterized protein
MKQQQHELATTLGSRKTMLLTTFKRDGTPVATPVSVAVDGERIFFRSYAETWKAKRLRRNLLAEVAPSTFRGKPRGKMLPAHAHLLTGTDAENARRALAHRHPLLQGLLVPLLHKLLRYTTVHYELTTRFEPVIGIASSQSLDCGKLDRADDRETARGND